jgi:CubicO group peptidase (beta-lactamase class C family)
MISFGEANLGHNEVNGRPVSAELIAAMQLVQKPIYTIRNGPNKQAMAWVNNLVGGNPNAHPVIMKNGGTSGFGNVIAINPTKDAAIFIGMNQVGADPAEKGVEILRRLP